MSIVIRKAQLADLNHLVPLFNAYRVFYQQESDEAAALRFLTERFTLFESVIFLAFKEETVIGFVQLFPTYSSVTLQRSLILNDLYVMPAHRGQSVGSQLLLHCQNYAQTKAYKGLLLETAHDNPARELYQKLGWKLDTHSSYYFWKSTI
ncbi:UNVERIFIED_CONTAM: hypothetical protein GTU68_013397 [Idotea baltica]|nr:hypothetical protein [Idotea baltica]